MRLRGVGRACVEDGVGYSRCVNRSSGEGLDKVVSWSSTVSTKVFALSA